MASHWTPAVQPSVEHRPLPSRSLATKKKAPNTEMALTHTSLSFCLTTLIDMESCGSWLHGRVYFHRAQASIPGLWQPRDRQLVSTGPGHGITNPSTGPASPYQGRNTRRSPMAFEHRKFHSPGSRLGVARCCEPLILQSEMCVAGQVAGQSAGCDLIPGARRPQISNARSSIHSALCHLSQGPLRSHEAFTLQRELHDPEQPKPAAGVSVCNGFAGLLLGEHCVLFHGPVVAPNHVGAPSYAWVHLVFAHAVQH